MRINYLSASIIPSRTANSVHVMKMCEALAANKHDVTLFAIRGKDTASAVDWYGTKAPFDIVYTERPAGRVVGALSYAYRQRRAAVERPLPELFYGRFIYGLAAVAGCGVPMIFEAHTLPSNAVQQRVERWLFRQPNFRRLVVISEALKEDYRRAVPGLDADHIVVAHDGASFLAGCVTGSPGEWPGRADALQLGYVGHLYPGKGVEIVVQLAKRMPEHDFHIVGGNEEELQAWSTIACGNLFFHGFVPHAQLKWYYDHMDICLAPLQYKVLVEGKMDIGRWTSPLKIFEYMAAARPIIASNISVLREVLTDGVTAELVAPDDLEAWQKAVGALESKDRRETLAGNAYREFVGRYTWQKRAAYVASFV